MLTIDDNLVNSGNNITRDHINLILSDQDFAKALNQEEEDDLWLGNVSLHEKIIDEGDKPICLLIYQGDLCDHPTIDYSINGYPSIVIGRDENVGKEVDASKHFSTDMDGKQNARSGGEKTKDKKRMVSKGTKKPPSTNASNRTSARTRTRASTRSAASTSIGMVDLTHGNGKGSASTSEITLDSVNEDELSFNYSSNEN
ncbi:hypothetical protein NE237_019508 [Protea cynaroides]|uniref:Uncharacterized protein n=1 Tax=Protea cynaroides TaxID=273540 RepID=A0A9Q0JSD2_9MAGN|nr:hypothetical protein NE237_019508 [Protea cynaroides]